MFGLPVRRSARLFRFKRTFSLVDGDYYLVWINSLKETTTCAGLLKLNLPVALKFIVQYSSFTPQKYKTQ